MSGILEWHDGCVYGRIERYLIAGGGPHDFQGRKRSTLLHWPGYANGRLIQTILVACCFVA